MILTKEQFKKFAPRAKRFSELYDTLDSLLVRFDIDTPERQAAFLAQCHYESAGFKYTKENLNYSASGLKRTFGKYFKDKDVYDYARQPEKIANLVYANRMGNGDEESGDGWKYRGRGYIQLTGYENYRRYAKWLKQDFPTIEEVLDYTETVRGAIECACWYWRHHNLNKWADELDMKTITKKINGGYNGLKSRITLYNRLLDMLEEEDRPKRPYGGRMNVTLQFGDINDDVKDLQRALGIKDDGHFGENTEKAVKEFQRKISTGVDGVADPYTLTKLYTGL